MDVVERLTLEAAQADTMIASEHRQRYELAAELCRGLRVVDLCCGSGYGSAILAGTAKSVIGIDVDLATIEAARMTVVGAHENVSFEASDALAYLERLGEGVDAVVCFEGLEHLPDLTKTLSVLRGRTEHGLRLVASVPNDRLFDAANPFHVTSFGYDEATAAFAEFPALEMVPQFLAEGSLILPPGADETDVSLALEDRYEPESANHFIFCVNFDREAVGRAHRGRMQLSAAPIFNRWSEDLKRGAWSLRRENARLARTRLGKADAAAGSALARLSAQNGKFAELLKRCRVAEARVAELEAELDERALAQTALDDDKVEADPRKATSEMELMGIGRAQVIDVRPLDLPAGEDPNSWEQRRRRAAEVIIPWIEQTVPLAGKVVLEYGCGHGSVTSALAARAKSVIGVDIDSEGIDFARRRLAERGVENAELEHRPVERILDAVRQHTGAVDVFVLYAVLEHLTVAERLDVLRLARDVVKSGGAIVVCETPNRLSYFDHHTAQIPFFHLLPDELAARTYSTSGREDFRAAMASAEERGFESLLHDTARWGRGVSYHEFEAVFGDLTRHVIASSYDPSLLRERPIHPEEKLLARYLDRHRPELSPAFSRQWLDLIIAAEPVTRHVPFLRPWTAETTESEGVGWTTWDNLRLRGPEAVLWVNLPSPTPRLLIGAVAEGARPLTLQAAPDGVAERLEARFEVEAPQTGYVTFEFDQPVTRVGLQASAACQVVFVGYEA